MDSLVYVKFKRNLLKSDIEKQLVDVVNTRIRSLANYMELRLNPEMILLVCNLIENGANSKKLKIDKKDLAMKVLHSVFSYSDLDKRHVSDTIEFLHSNNKIKRVRLLKKIFAVLYNWIKRKL